MRCGIFLHDEVGGDDEPIDRHECAPAIPVHSEPDQNQWRQPAIQTREGENGDNGHGGGSRQDTDLADVQLFAALRPARSRQAYAMCKTIYNFIQSEVYFQRHPEGAPVRTSDWPATSI
jgi:hypothetical protein